MLWFNDREPHARVPATDSGAKPRALITRLAADTRRGLNEPGSRHALTCNQTGENYHCGLDHVCLAENVSKPGAGQKIYQADRKAQSDTTDWQSDTGCPVDR